ncbi:MAG: hypothetical protein EU547_04085 [Promethearchaeota archaeon]|nr:MAG: hypothetical protein EU547_04085 [Candidatus Lokiarchaeota archaeon]
MNYNGIRDKKRRASRILSGHPARLEKVHRILYSLDPLHPISGFTTKKYSSIEYFKAFEQASLRQESIKHSSLMARAKGRKVPSPEQLMKCCRTVSAEDVTTCVNYALGMQFKALPQNIRHQLTKSGILIIDFHQDCYYGKRDNPHVRTSRTKKSTNLFYEYLTADIYCKNGSFTIALLHRSKGKTLFALTKELIEYVKCVFTPKIIIFDGEFAVLDILAYFESQGFYYLGRKSQTSLVKAHKNRYYLGSNWEQQRQWREIELRSKKGHTRRISIDICAQNVHGTMKFLIKSPNWNITVKYAVKLYGKRFNIETGYRDKHKFHIFTCTKILSTRLLFFLIAILEWNCWQAVLIWVRALKSYSKDLPRIVMMQLALNWTKLVLYELFHDPLFPFTGGDE